MTWHAHARQHAGKDHGTDLWPSDELRCDWTRPWREGGRSVLPAAVAEAQTRRRFGGGACPSFYPATSGEGDKQVEKHEEKDFLHLRPLNAV